MKLLPLAIGVLACLASTVSPAATFILLNGDDPGVGFNDPTPVAPVGMNIATTRGAQRLAVLQAAMDYWGVRIASNVPIHVAADHLDGECTPDVAFLANGMPVDAFSDYFDAESPEPAHIPVALYNARDGQDATPGNAALADYDVRLAINPLIDTGCAGFDGWWYDTDPDAHPPGNRLSFLLLLRQELARGLGQFVFGDPATGARWFDADTSDRLDSFLLDTSYPAPGIDWVQMTTTERAASARNYPALVWGGAAVTQAAAGWLDPMPVLQLHGPAAALFETRRGAQLGSRPPKIGTLGGRVVAVVDGTAPAGDGCQPPVNAADLAGNIALVDRGECTFAVKAAAAQATGAIAVLVADNVAGGRLPAMGGTDPALVIPALGISQAAGALLRSPLAPRVTFGHDLRRGAETTNGNVRMAAEAEPPSARLITQFVRTATPAAMGAARFGLTRNHDSLSFAALRDLGWQAEWSAPNAAPYIDLPSPFAAVANRASTLTELWFGDIDAGTLPLTLVFEVGAGVIELQPDAALQTLGSGTDSARVTGSRLALQTYVEHGGVRFRSPPGTGADVALVVTIDDHGNSGVGGEVDVPRTASATATISMVANTAPSAVGQTLSAAPGTARMIDLAGTDPDGDGLAFAPVTQPLHGTLSGQLGHYEYTPDAGFVGSDHFDFIALDGVLASAPARISIVVIAGGGADRLFSDGFEG